jgi:protein-tyrosine phosphatase
MSGFVDLHCHYVPAIDDGVDTLEEGKELCRGLFSLGFQHVVATPHIRTAMFENRREPILQAHAQFGQAVEAVGDMPTLSVAAEHYFDDIFWSLFCDGEAVPYRGKKTMLVELPPRSFPLRLHEHFFQMSVRGTRPVLAHPERYDPLFRTSEPLQPLIAAGALPLLDIMSLTGKYGRAPKKAAERMLDEDLYYAACSDAHRPKDVPKVAKAIQILERRLGRAHVTTLLSDRPRRILEGDVDV